MLTYETLVALARQRVAEREREVREARLARTLPARPAPPRRVGEPQPRLPRGLLLGHRGHAHGA